VVCGEKLTTGMPENNVVSLAALVCQLEIAKTFLVENLSCLDGKFYLPRLNRWRQNDLR
jgi:hypothetical protein